MADHDLKRHPPTERRLERMRQSGDVPHSPALTGAVALAAGSLAALMVGPTLVAWLGARMAQDLQQAAAGEVAADRLAGLLAGHLAVAVAVTVLGGVVVAGGAVLGHALQTCSRSGGAAWGHGPQLPGATADARAAKTRKGAVLSLELVLGLAGMGLLVAQIAQRLAAASNWGDVLPAREAGVLWLRWLAVLGGMGLLQWARVRASYWRRASMSDRDMREEAREVAGPPLTQQRRRLSLRDRIRHEA